MSDDPLTRIDPGLPCPSCGYRVSLRALSRVRDGLRRKKAEQGGRTIWGRKTLQVDGGGGGGGGRGGTIVLDVKEVVNTAPDSPISAGSGLTMVGRSVTGHAGVGNPLTIDGEVCARCGTFWKPDARQEALGMEEEIRNLRLEVESAVDLLGRVSEDESK